MWRRTTAACLRIGAALAACLWAISQTAPLAQTPRGALVPPREDAPAVCGTRIDSGLRGQAIAPNGLADGEPMFFDQDPPLVRPDYTGPITLRNFSVVGDFATVEFIRFDPDTVDGVTETWKRVTSRSVSGQLISIFEPTWSSAQLARTLGIYRVGHDRPDLSWGNFKVPNSSTQRTVRLRVGFAGLPSSQVVRINDRVQYASSVVNLVVPDFGDMRVVRGQNGFEIDAATKLFFEYFADQYDVLAIQPQSTTLADYGAYHRNVVNAVRGLNLSIFDQASLFGSNGTLEGVEVYASSYAARYEDSNHEMAHQWGSTFDWTRIAGITRGGHDPSAHSPLWTGGETLIGAVLYGDRRVRTTTAGLEIERTPPAAQYHPMELYAMGAIRSDQVPPFDVMEDQQQFDADSVSSPDVGSQVKGGVRHVTIDDVIREHGPRSGPAPKIWRRGLIYVSRDRLASAAEMDYWNFYAQRLGDRGQSNPATYGGYGSFRLATRNAITLSTAITPRNGSALPETIDTSSPVFGPADWRDVVFTGPVPTRFRVGDTTILSGRLSAQDAQDFDQISLVMSRADGGRIRFDGSVSRTRDFSVALRFGTTDRGQYSMGAYLFWPTSGAQFARATLSTFTVE